MTVSAPPPANSMYPNDLGFNIRGHQLTYTGAPPGGKRLPAPSFHALVEIFNPLEHLPIVSTVYQAVTGDHPSPGQQIIGDTIYGGPIGFLAAVVHIMVNGAAKIFEGKGETAPKPPAAVASATTTAPAEAANTIETGGKARGLGLTPDTTLPNTILPSPTVTANTAAVELAANPVAPDAGSAAFGPASSNLADPGAISGPLTDTGSAAATLPAKNVPVPLPAPDATSAEAAPSTPAPAKKVAALGHKPVFMPLPAQGTHFFPLNNGPTKTTFYRMNSRGPVPADTATTAGSTPSTASAARTPQAPPPTTANAASERPISLTPSAMAAALAPAIDAPQPPSFAPASSLSDPLAPSLSSAALATTQAASDKYNKALDLAQKLKFFYGAATPGRGLSP